MASPGASYQLSVHLADWWYDGTLEIGSGHVQLLLEEEFLAPADAAMLAVDFPKAQAVAASAKPRLT